MSQHYLILICFVACLALVNGSGLEDDLVITQMDSHSSLIYWLWHQWKWMMKLVFKISSLPILPFLWMTSWLWRHLVMTPLTLAVHATHVMYPVLIYCGAACLCGLVIGGCSGFAAEAMSSAAINATWGKQQTTKLDETMDDTETIHSDDDDDETDSMYWRRASQYSPASSMYRFSISSDMTTPSSYYDDKPYDDQDPEQIASFLRQRHQQQHD